MQETYPLLKDRIQSTLVDTVFLVVLMFAFSSILDKFSNVPGWVRMVMFALVIAYEPLCMTFGATLGNYLGGIRVRQNTDLAKRINIFQAVVRYPVKVLLGLVSFLTINSNPKRRAIHDMISGSVMIKL